MTHNLIRILPGTHLYTWVESSNVDKVPCWRTKVPRYRRESNPEPFDSESRVQSNIPRHLHHYWTIPLNILYVQYLHFSTHRTVTLNAELLLWFKNFVHSTCWSVNNSTIHENNSQISHLLFCHSQNLKITRYWKLVFYTLLQQYCKAGTDHDWYRLAENCWNGSYL